MGFYSFFGLCFSILFPGSGWHTIKCNRISRRRFFRLLSVFCNLLFDLFSRPALNRILASSCLARFSLSLGHLISLRRVCVSVPTAPNRRMYMYTPAKTHATENSRATKCHGKKSLSVKIYAWLFSPCTLTSPST